VTLDRDIIFGRSPQATASRAAHQPHLVKVADPGVSRNHVHVALDGWQVLVRDLGSSNGTEIQLPGGEVEKLRSGEDYLVEAGTVLTLAGDIQYTYEVTP
jgi:pSer/pThr/pTyr-binding forkhead associated (FHA) protein